MVNTEIYLGSGTSVTFVPELDIYIKAASATTNEITLHSDLTDNFALVTDLYIGCEIEFWDAGAYISTHRITSNTATKITIHPVLPSIFVAGADWFHIRGYGAPCPAPKAVTGTTTYVSEVTTVTTVSDTKADYSADIIIVSILPSSAGTETTHAFWFDDTGSVTIPAGASAADAASEISIDDAGIISKEEYAAVLTTAINAVSNISATRSGAVITITNTYGGPTSATTTTDAVNLVTVATVSGSTTAADDTKRLNADNWLGLVDSLTFPTTEVEFKQLNLFVGGSRNFTHQYKGIETAGGASIAVTANHGAWLYYFLGKCDSITSDLSSGTNPTSDFAGNTASENKYYLDNTSFTKTGPLFYRSINNVMCPPVLEGIDNYTDLDQLTEPTVTAGAIVNPITYTTS
jgi:hypothetical protein